MDWACVVAKITGSVNEHLLQRNEYLLTENRVLRSRLEKRPRFTDPERLALATAAKPLGRALLAEIATLVTPDTLLRWHRRLVEKVTPQERDARSGPGRPPVDPAVVEFVLQFARENPSWGYDRIAGALKELGHTISDAAVGNTLKENSVPPAPERKKGTSWADFVVIHKDVLVACDFFTKEVWTLLGPVTYYVLFFMHVANRKVHVAGFTPNPDENWMKQIARNVTMAGGFFDGMKYLILDRDGKFAPSFRDIIASAGVELLRLPPRSPNLNAFAERFVRSIKEECLDHLILFGEPSLQRAIDNFIEHYHYERPHQGKDNVILFPTQNDANPARAGPVSCNRRLGGLLKFYYRKAG
jgi:putative transposase